MMLLACAGAAERVASHGPHRKSFNLLQFFRACQKSFLIRKEYAIRAIRRSPHQMETYCIYLESYRGFNCNILQK